MAEDCGTQILSLCEETLKCQGAPAVVYCEACEIFQCGECDSFVHSAGLKDHVRRNLRKMPSCNLLCQGRNTAVVRCEQCSNDFCTQCDQQWHSKGKRNDHHRISLVHSVEKVAESKTVLPTSFLLIDHKEELMVTDVNDFVRKLHCDSTSKVKVVSIFGNTGDGKSHALNHSFFEGEEVFRTSATQSSCTIGIWAAYSSKYQSIFIDSEGLLGVSENENIRTRLLLKILAISDVVVYRTRAERLHNDLFTFLADASDAYWKYFMPELQAASNRYKLEISLSSLGPSVVVFHETVYAQLLGEFCSPNNCHFSVENCVDGSEDGSLLPFEGYHMNSGVAQVQHISADELLRIRFTELGCIPKSFCSIEYVGTRTRQPPTDFSGFCKSVVNLLKNNSIRAPRKLEVIYTALEILNRRFSGELQRFQMRVLPDAYFSCQQECLSCGMRCELSMNHKMDGGIPHKISTARCRYNHHYDNKVYLCKDCFDCGTESVVEDKFSSSKDGAWTGVAKYMWSGSVLECRNCGIIYRSRQYWYGNQDPEIGAVKRENKHVWPEDIKPDSSASASIITARKLLESVSSAANVVTAVTSTPTKMVCSWVTDQITPQYWVPNHKILVCSNCKTEFQPSQTKHHCRACGEGLCGSCLSKQMPVPWRGWGTVPVKVCQSCYDKYKTQTDKSAVDLTDTVTARYLAETAIGAVSGVMRFSTGMISESTRPTYWTPDSDIHDCSVCKVNLDYQTKHHCRACGHGVCERCSQQKQPVPSRGWSYPVRVCDICIKLLTNGNKLP